MVHGNLKAENFIFENDNDDSNVKISDIALYPLLDRELLKHTISTSPQYCGKFVLYKILNIALFILDLFTIYFEKLLRYLEMYWATH